MCTLTLAWNVFDDAPVAVAANRDESLERGATPPARYREEPLIIAPQDERAGGTWIGVNEHGVFAGITNRWTGADLAGERSRGLLVAEALNAQTATEAAAQIEAATARHTYDGFNLVIADAAFACCLEWDGSLTRTVFDPGVHVVVNVAVNDDLDIPPVRSAVGLEQAANARRVRQTLAPNADEDAVAWLERAGTVLGDHEYGVCLHGDGFGTRSSSLLAIGETLYYAFAAGPPCQTPYEECGLESHI